MRLDVVCSVSMHCNLRCKYCDVLPLVSDRRKMALDQVKLLFEHVRSYVSKIRTITTANFQWFGGEPLLISPDTYKSFFEWQRRIFDGVDTNITNSIQSNFTVMDDSRIRLLRDEFDEVGISMDVFADLRKTEQGTSLEGRAIENLNRVRQAGVRVSAISVLTRPLLTRISSLYDFFSKHELDFRLLPLERGLYNPGQDFEVTPLEIRDSFCALADCSFIDTTPVAVEPLIRTLFLVKHMLRNDENRVDIYDPIASPSVVLVGVDGSVYSYGERFGEPLGNIFESPLEQIIAGPSYMACGRRTVRRIENTCGQCAYFGKACSGDPIGEGEQDMSVDKAITTRKCEVAKYLIEHITTRVKNNYGWANAALGETMFRNYGAML